jgi:predicted transcriptional regulator
MNTPAAIKTRRPITRDGYALLVGLAAGGQTAVDLQSRVLADAGVHISLTSILSALRRLEEMGLVESESRVYWLAEKGWPRLISETRTFEELAQHAKRRVLESGHGRW